MDGGRRLGAFPRSPRSFIRKCRRRSRSGATAIRLFTGCCGIPGAVCEFEGACDKDEKTGTCKPEGVAVELCDAIIRILDYLAYMGVDVEAVLMAKHEYNKGREYRHGGKRA